MNKICQPLGASSLAVMIVAIAAAVQSGAADDELDTAPAMAAAQSWLGTVDAGRYAQSWEDAAKAFRDAVPKEKWESLAEPVRAQTGVLIARKVRTARYTREIPNAPAGEYVVIQYDSRFERIPHAIETVTPMKDPDGKWRVSGYFVKPG
jgi:hypothetical protein